MLPHFSERSSEILWSYYTEKLHKDWRCRCQSGRVNVAELLKELTDGIGKGGGHPQAAGAEVRIEHKDEFFQRLDAKLSGL